MKSTHIVGKSVEIKRPSHQLFSAFTDMRHFVERLPEDKKSMIEATEDTIEGNVKGIKLGARIAERVPFSYVKITDYGTPIFPFEVGIFFDAIDSDTTRFHIEFDAELNFMMKMMIGGKLQDGIDKATEQLALAVEGKIDPADMNFTGF